MKNNRFEYIDFLRVLAIVVILITHTFSFHLNDRLIFIIWNYLHFLVVVLVFTSGYVLTFKYWNYFSSFSKTLTWYKKRLIRILAPFYYYLGLHYLLWYLFPEYFSGLGLKKSTNFIIQSILLTGGVDFNWFALLFVQLTLLFPLAMQIVKRKLLSFIFIILSIGVALFFSFFDFQGNSYRYFMWMSWINIIFFSVLMSLKEQKESNLKTTLNRYLFIGGISFVFFILAIRLIPLGKELVLTQHKYPPDIIYLTYGISITCILLIISRYKFLYLRFLQPVIRFISKQTYQLFFIHYLALDVTFKLSKNLVFWSNPFIQTILVIGLSLGVVLIINFFQKFKRKKQLILIAVLVLLVFIFLANLKKNSLTCLPEDKNPIAKSAILEWLQKPAAIRFIGKFDRTYISWIEHKGKIQMRYYDHKKKVFSDIYTVDDLYPDYGIEAQDDHNAPSLLILPDGRLLIFYVVHDANNAFFMKTSTSREDITRWGKRSEIYDKGTNIPYNYPQAKRLSNGKIILFYRRGVFYNSDEYFKLSYDNGITWSEPIKLIDFNGMGIYAFIFSKENQIYIAWNKAAANPPKKNIYYAFSPDGGKSWEKKNGSNLDLPITEKNADLVFNSYSEPSYVWDIVADEANNPFIVFAFKNDPDHEFRFAKWNGTSWLTSRITKSYLHYNSGNFFSGGIVIDPNYFYKVYLSKKHRKLEIESFESKDQGETWKRAETITDNSLVDNFRPQLVLNYSSDLRLIWSSGKYEGLINSQWSGFSQVNLQSEITKNSSQSVNCKEK